MESCPLYSLSEITEQYLLMTDNVRKKYFSKYLVIAANVYRELFREIMPTPSTKYVEVIHDKNEPFPFVWKPKGMMRFLGVWVPNKKGHLVQAFYDDRLDVYTKPKRKLQCGCDSNGLKDSIDSLQVTINPIVIDGTTYYEKIWVKCCQNGDVLQYREVPVKKYNNTGGDYGNDYGDDYDIINSGDNVIVLRYTTNIGKMEVKPCGCPIESDHNKHIIYDKCGCHLSYGDCKIWYKETRNCVGTIKWSECGDKLYLKDVRDNNGYVLISAQYDPITCGEEVFVIEYARAAIWAGIDCYSKLYHPQMAVSQKQLAKQNYRSEQTKLFEYLNPLNSDRFFNNITSELKL